MEHEHEDGTWRMGPKKYNQIVSNIGSPKYKCARILSATAI